MSEDNEKSITPSELMSAVKKVREKTLDDYREEIDALLRTHEESFRGNQTGYVRTVIGECRRLIREGQ
jgi:hypothetical protein